MSKALDFRLEKVGRPPPGVAWVWHTIELMASPAWRARSNQLAKLLELLELEHLRHGGAENGLLRQTYSQIDGGGVSRKFIAATIEEGEALGLLSATPGMRLSKTESQMTTFRLTYLPAKVIPENRDRRPYYVTPSNEWKSVTADKAAAISGRARLRRAKATGTSKNANRSPEREPSRFHKGNCTGSPTGTALIAARSIACTPEGTSVPEREDPYISWGDTGVCHTSITIDGAAIKRERERRKLSLRALASIAGTSHNAVALVEKGRLNGAALQKIAAALDITIGAAP